MSDLSHSIKRALVDNNIVLPAAPAPAANYVPFIQSGSILYVSGQLSQSPTQKIVGKLGDTCSLDNGVAAARLCAINLLAQVQMAIESDWALFKRVVKITGFVNSTAEFTQQPQVINGASDLLALILQDAGQHARAAVSAASLPFGVAVEIEGIFELHTHA